MAKPKVLSETQRSGALDLLEKINNHVNSAIIQSKNLDRGSKGIVNLIPQHVMKDIENIDKSLEKIWHRVYLLEKWFGKVNK
jgi:hypothetical protein